MFAGKRRKPDWLTTETVLSYFGEEKKEAIADYKNYFYLVETFVDP